MAHLGNVFDPNEVPADDRNFEPLPPGNYECQVTESDLVDIAKGQMLKLTIEVITGPYEGRKLWSNLCIRHESPQAQSIAQRALADLCAAVGAGAISDSEELHFRPFVANVGIQKNDPERNEVKRFRPLGGAAPAAKAQPQAQRTAPAQQPRSTAPAGNRPWNRSAA